MANMVVQAFDSRDDAEAARGRLIESGFDATRIRVEGGEATQGPVRDRRNKEPAWAHAEKNGLAGFLERMFSGLLAGDNEIERYAKAMRSGKSVVALYVTDEATASRASAILRETIEGLNTRDPTMRAGRPYLDPIATLSVPRIYPLPNSPTGWSEAMRGDRSVLSVLQDPARPEGLMRDAEALDRDEARRDQ